MGALHDRLHGGRGNELAERVSLNRRCSRRRYWFSQGIVALSAVLLFWLGYRFTVRDDLPLWLRYLIVMLLAAVTAGWVPFQGYEKAMRRWERLAGDGSGENREEETDSGDAGRGDSGC